MAVGVFALLALSGCEKPAPPPAGDTKTQIVVPDDTQSAATPTDGVNGFPGYAEWAGKWTGPEGLYVTVTPESDGSYALEMQSDLDTKARYIGQEIEGGIAFKRGDAELLLHAATGDETGLKYLAGKQNCLMVEVGEGYCRDS